MFSVSVIFHPLFITLYASIYYLFSNQKNIFLSEKVEIISSVIIYTFISPLLLYFILKQYNQIQSIMVATTTERKLPLLINCILLTQLSFDIDNTTAPELYSFVVGCIISSAIALFYSYLKIKISLHMIGIAVLVAFVFYLSRNETIDLIIQIVLLITIGLVASARLILKAHTYKELYLGFVCGVLPQIIVYSM